MLVRLFEFLKAHPMTGASAGGTMAQVVAMIAQLCGLSPHQEAALVNLGNNLTLLFGLCGAVVTIGRHCVQVARELWLPPPGTQIVANSPVIVNPAPAGK